MKWKTQFLSKAVLSWLDNSNIPSCSSLETVYQVTSENELGSFLNMSHWAKWDKTIIYCV